MAKKLPSDSPPLDVKIIEAARLLSLSERTIYRMLDTRELDSVGSGRRRRIPYASLLAYRQRTMTGTK